jgi:hypothetical protein
LGNQCFTPDLLKDILGASAQPWPQLKTLTLYPKEDMFDAVRDALEDAVDSRRQRAQSLPELKLFCALEDLQGNGAEPEILF